MDLIVLYFIINLLNYDEIIDYSTIDKSKRSNIRPIAFLFLVANLANLLFVIVFFMSAFLAEYFTRSHGRNDANFS